MEFLFNLMIFSGMFVFISTRKHLLLTLMSLEYMVLVNFLLMFFLLFNFGFEFNILLMYLTFCICEGVLGLGILISLIRCHGNDMLMSFMLMKW